MANFTTVSATKALTQNAEWSVAQNAAFNASAPKTTSGYVTVWLDLTTIVAGDVLQIRVYRAIAGGTLTPDDIVTAVPGTIWSRNVGLVGGNWDVTVKLTTATGRTIGFEVTQDTNDVNAASIGSGAIGATQIGSAAFTAAKFATDAIDSNAIAASAVTEIQSGLATSVAVASVQTDTATLTTRLSAGRAANLDNIDATVSSRAAAATALSSADYTSARAAKLDNLDAAISGRASAVAVAAVQADADDIQSRLPTALDGDGNIKAGVQTVVSGVIDSIVAGVFAFVEESGAPAGARTFLERLRIKWSILAAKASGLAIQAANSEHFRDGADTKDRATFTLGTDGTRTPGTFDGT